MANGYSNILVSFEKTKTSWQVMLLTFTTETIDAPAVFNFDGIENVLVAWATHDKIDYPVYLQTTDMSKSKQKFALGCAFSILRGRGYKLESP